MRSRTVTVLLAVCVLSAGCAGTGPETTGTATGDATTVRSAGTTATTPATATSVVTTERGRPPSRLQIESQVNATVPVRVVLTHPSNGTEFYNRTVEVPPTETTFLGLLVGRDRRFGFTVRLGANESVSGVAHVNEGYEVTIRDRDTLGVHELTG